MPLPKKGTPEFVELEKKYIVATKEERTKMAGEYGFATRHNFQTRMSQGRGVLLPPQKRLPIETTEVKAEVKVEYLPYPDLKIKPFKVGKIQRDEEDIGIVMSDAHAGRLTDSYSPDIYKARMDFLLESAMTIINLHRPIRNAYIIDVGDDVQGENVKQGSKIGTTAMSAKQQIFDLALPTQVAFAIALKQGVEKVIIHRVKGNHGRYDRTAPSDTNWDLFLGEALKSALENQRGIEVNLTDKFYALFEIRGFRFFCIHGDQVRSSQGLPLFALRRKYQEYFALFNFHYAYNGHWHVGGKDSINSIADYTICPPLVTGDEWALEIIGRASKPVQLAFGIHNQFGRTWEYHLQCDKDFLPQPFLEGANHAR